MIMHVLRHYSTWQPVTLLNILPFCSLLYSYSNCTLYPSLSPIPCALSPLQTAALTCAMATGSAPWDRTAGTVSARQAGGALGAASPWKLPVQTTKTMKEVRQHQTSQHIWCSHSKI